MSLQRVEHRFVAMGGPCRLRLDCEHDALATSAIAAAEAEVRRLEAKYSRYLEDSLTSRINHSAGSGERIEIDAETSGLLHYADTLWRESDGEFDLTSGILRQAWDFKSGEVPGEAALQALLPRIGWNRVQRDETSIALPDAGMELDFGGCVKEYASDSAATRLREHGIEHALVDLAGDMVALGSQGNGEPWHIGIRHPRERSHAIAQVPLDGACLASSGDYERCIEIDGERYGHILSPKTGRPVQGLVGVSVIAAQCLVAGSTATLAMLKPAGEALAWLEQLGLPWLAIDRDFNCHGSIRTAG